MNDTKSMRSVQIEFFQRKTKELIETMQTLDYLYQNGKINIDDYLTSTRNTIEQLKELNAKLEQIKKSSNCCNN